jgi:hypothetical protein
MLEFPARWRFNPPVGTEVPPALVDEFFRIAKKTAAQASDRQQVLEMFKAEFARGLQTTTSTSSNEYWAEVDLRSTMDRAAINAATFLEALYDVSKALGDSHPEWAVPSVPLLNELCVKYGAPYRLAPPRLVAADAFVTAQGYQEPVQVHPSGLLEQAHRQFRDALARSDELLRDRRGREAVQEILWLLESVATAFKGLEAGGQRIKGGYFNAIIRELRQRLRGTALSRVVEWIEELHGYLSTPTGGGVRHGLDLQHDPIEFHEAMLFCNLIRSYLSYLLAEYEKMTRGQAGDDEA